MGRRIGTPPTTLDDERVLRWRYACFTQPLATDPCEYGEATLRRIRDERDRLDASRLPLADRLEALAGFVSGELSSPSIARRAMASEPPEVLR